MFSLPNLDPQDFHSLWYNTSNSNATLHVVESNGPSFEPPSTPPEFQTIESQSHRRNALDRTPLARLRFDEENMERRKLNVQNYGSSWIRPPGISKSLHQLREEKREMEEHQEALRREQLAQELAEAEAEGVDDLLQGEGMDGEMEEVRDLDDEVPEADTTRLDAEDSEIEDDENDSEEVPRGVLASRMPEDVYREALVRGEEVRTGRFGDDEGSTIDEEDPSQILQEEDLVHETRGTDQELDMDMDADLDDDIPEAGGYEHTDTEEELSSSDEESFDAGLPRRNPAPASSMVRSDGTQNSMDLSSMISESSPQQLSGFSRRQSRQ